MSESSATHKQMTPEGKPKSSFMVEPGKGSDTMGVSQEIGNSEKSIMTEAAEKGAGDLGEKMSPAGKPTSSFINTSAVK